MKVKEKDLDILTILRKNSRIRLSKISKKLQIPVSSIYNRINMLEKNKVILKYTSLIESNYLKYNLKHLIFVKLKKECNLDELEKIFSKININSVIKVNAINENISNKEIKIKKINEVIIIETKSKNNFEFKDLKKKIKEFFEIIKIKEIYKVEKSEKITDFF